MDKFHSLSRRARLAWLGAAAAAAALFLLWLLSRATGQEPFGPSAYNTYTLQALAWREGLLWLPRDYPHLELAIFQGEFYVSFPPLPSVVLLPFTFLFGEGTPDGLLVKLYLVFAFLAAYLCVAKASGPKALFWAAFYAFASSFLPIAGNGAVWYQAQLLAFLLTTLSAVFAVRAKITPSLVCYALAVGCRPFNAVFGLAIAALILARKPGARKLVPGVLAGLAIGLCYAAYNCARFGNPFEFGHNYLPEFTRSESGQFSLAYFWDNAKLVFARMPFSGGEAQKFGFNIAMANPLLALLGAWFLADLWRRRVDLPRAAIVFACAAQLFLLMLHKSFGGFQFGLRYGADLLPFALMYLLVSGRYRRIRWWEAATFAAAMIFMAWGALNVHI